MIIIGLTGSVGMGKTEVSTLFKRNNIKIFDSDAYIKLLYKNKKILKKIEKNFPDAFIRNNINKKYLTELVFNDKKKLIILEKILHKRLQRIQALWIRRKLREKEQIVVFDVPLLFEKDNIKKYDIILVVNCSKEIQRNRVLKRDGWNEERLKKTINSQYEDNIKIKMADIVIKTDRGKRTALEQVMKVIEYAKYKHKRITSKILFYYR